MQAGGEGIARVTHRTVIAEIGNAGHRIFGNDHRVGNVRSAIGIEVADHRQLREIDGIAFNDLFQNRTM